MCERKEKKPSEKVLKSPDNSPLNNFWNFFKNKSESGGGNKTHESIVTSPVLHLNKNPDPEESTRIQVYPAMAVVVNTFNKDGTLKNSVTHFQPDFNSFKADAKRKEATYVGNPINADNNFKSIQNPQHTVNNFLWDVGNGFSGGGHERPKDRLRQGGAPWPFAGYSPLREPFLSGYNAFASSMYNAVSSMVEYAPETNIYPKDTAESVERIKTDGRPSQTAPLDRYRKQEDEEEEVDPDFFDEVTMRSERINKKPLRISNDRQSTRHRRKRDASSIFLKTRRGDKVDITLEEPSSGIDAIPSSHDEKARSFSPILVNTPPLSTILRPPHQESRQFLGYADKKRKTKPSKPIKEEGSNEEIGEEQEEESSSQGQESGNEAVAISPPPEGASVAEAKPIGLAIAGPGGVAASKPQGTAVAGPGGLAIARPVGTAIAGVEVEGSVPIGGQQKNKKKPKQEQEQTETELHYVGGLTGPIGNPKPKEFADRIFHKSVKETQGNNIQDNLFFRGRHDANGFQFKLGQQDGKYGFIPMFAASGADRLQKRMDSPTFFHGLLGNEGNDQFQNYQMHY